MRFSKMNGAGNDYIYIDVTKRNIQMNEQIIKHLCNRNFGIGSDGVVLIHHSEVADFRMQMFNNDGSEAEMCGNASRCIGRFLYDKGLCEKEDILLETKAGIKNLHLNIVDFNVESVTVDLGTPKIGVVNQVIEAEGEEFVFTEVSMGNPHAVIFLDEIENLDIEKYGKSIENNAFFPNRTNVEFAKVIDRSTIDMRVWERGSGETLACGTGAAATLVAAHNNGLVDNKAKVKLKGGDLELEWDKNKKTVYLTGDAKFSFEGEVSLGELL